MMDRLLQPWTDSINRQRIAIAIAKGGAMMQARSVDPRQPQSWEFSGFSQNGEDGILDVLRRKLLNSNRYFVEIGAADGIENNTAWLLVAEKYSGLMIEGDRKLVRQANRLVMGYSIGAESRQLILTRDNFDQVQNIALHNDPDVFSLDIDGIDYYVAQAILNRKFRPKIFVVEYNSAFGPARSMTIEYRDDFDFRKAHPSQLYYGVSLAAWQKLFSAHGYRFVTVDSHGVNAFFVDESCFDSDFLDQIDPLQFAENQYQLRKFRLSSEKQFELIAGERFKAI